MEQAYVKIADVKGAKMRQYVTVLTMIAEYSNHSIKPGTYIFFLLHCGTFVPPKFKLHILWDGF